MPYIAVYLLEVVDGYDGENKLGGQVAVDSLAGLLILTLGVIGIIVLTAKLRVHAFLALVAVSIVMGLALGLPSSTLVTDVVEGFGGTLGYVGLIALAACILGQLLKETGASTVISESILRLLGKSRSPLAIGAAGYLVAPSVNCNDTSFLILSPVAKALGNVGCCSNVLVPLALAAGAYTSFKLVFPGAPLYAATMFNANLVEVILLGLLVSIPVFAVGLLWTYAYVRYGFKQTALPNSVESGERPRTGDKKLPSVVMSYGIVAVPLTLILVRSLVGMYIPEASSIRASVEFLGHPVIAMLVAVGIALFAARAHSREKVSEWVGEGVARGASIIAIVGGGGVLGRILVDAGVGKALVSSIAGFGISGALVIFMVAAVIKTAQGSSMVTMITAPSILMPLLPSLGISPTLATLLVSAGAMVSIHVNDSYFWVVTGFSQMSVSEGIKSLTVMSVLQGITVLVLVTAIRSLLPTI
jgi:GntP family gluconate:H+ symporter